MACCGKLGHDNCCHTELLFPCQFQRCLAQDRQVTKNEVNMIAEEMGELFFWCFLMLACGIIFCS